MRLYLIRHAQAGDRLGGSRDVYRPLSPKGRARALDLAALLGDAGIDSILSSPASRCVQTVEPLAANLGLEVVEQADLFEGTPLADVLTLFEQLTASRAIAACSHGDVIPDVIDELGRSGIPITGRGCEKGSVWVLDHDGAGWTSARYLNRSVATLP